MNGRLKQLIILGALMLGFAMVTQMAHAETYSNKKTESGAYAVKKIAKTGELDKASGKTIIGGFKSMSGMDAMAEDSRQLIYQLPVVEPPEAVDDIAIFQPVEPPQPANNILTGQVEPEPPTASGDFNVAEAGEVNLEWMAAYIDTVLQDQVVGYAYAINKDGSMVKSNAEGLARTADDDQLNMSIHTRSYVASVTKQITAIATIKILHQAGLTVNTPIADYLPQDWTQGAGFSGLNAVTFADLMTHDTGFGQFFDQMKNNDDQESLDNWGNDWDGLSFVVSNGAMPGSGYAYKNANYALLRVLIPEIWVQMGGAPYAEVTEGNHSLMYLSYLYQNVLEPAGIYYATCWMQPEQEEALAYSKDFVEEGGVAHEITIQSCGGHSGFRLSAYELARYLAYLRHSDEIITYVQLGLANTNLFGWGSDADNVYSKSGMNFNTFSIDATNNIGGQVYATQNTIEFRKTSHACVMIFPNGYEASIVVNSAYKAGFEYSTCDVLKNAYQFTVSQ